MLCGSLKGGTGDQKIFRGDNTLGEDVNTKLPLSTQEWMRSCPYWYEGYVNIWMLVIEAENVMDWTAPPGVISRKRFELYNIFG